MLQVTLWDTTGPVNPTGVGEMTKRGSWRESVEILAPSHYPSPDLNRR